MTETLEKALGLALSQVNRRERSVAEIRAHLTRKGISETTTEAVIEELVASHAVDDERFAEMFITDKRELESWGSERIRRGLVARGIERELAERALAQADLTSSAIDAGGPGAVDATSPSELDRALALLRRRFPDPPRDRRDRDRALGVLLRKGYESELALEALAVHARDAAAR